jgi:hypothetical protein
VDDKKIQSALQDALEAEIPSKSVHLWPRVKAAFATENTQHGIKMNTTLRYIAFTALAISILLAIVLVTPQGRAFSQRMVQYFVVTEEKSFPIPTDEVFPVPETPTPPPTQLLPLQPALSGQAMPTTTPDAACSSAAAQSIHICQVKAAEAQAGFNAKEFLYDPKGMKFSAVTFTPSTGEINFEYVVTTGGGYLYLRQGISDFPDPKNTWGKVPSDAVEQVSVNGLYAEVASGTFVVYPNATLAVWEPGGLLSLAWRDGDHWFVLEKLGDPYPIEWITKDQLIKLAEGLVDERPADIVPPLDPEYLATVEQAEALAGFDIPTPAILPVGYELKQVAWIGNVARLMYGPKRSPQSELYISLGQITDNNQMGPCSECPAGVTEEVQVGPWQGWYWRGIFQGSAPSVTGQPTPTPNWDSDASHWSLAWNSDTFWFSMFYSPAYNSGKETNKELLIEIAESLK